jgi:hypothetical protein
VAILNRNRRGGLVTTAVRRLSYLAAYGHYIPTEYYVLDEQRLVYVSIPKVASTSIKLATMGQSTGGAHLGDREQLQIHREAVGNQVFRLPSRASNYFKFAFVRNPFDRMVSCFEDKARNEDQHTGHYHFESRYNKWVIRRLFGDEFRPTMSFEEFLALVGRIPDWLADSHFKSQYSMLYQHGKPIPDYIGKFENLAADWDRIAAEHNLGQLQKSNVSPHRTWKEYYHNGSTIEAVRRRYQKDIEVFGYGSEYEELILGTEECSA